MSLAVRGSGRSQIRGRDTWNPETKISLCLCSRETPGELLLGDEPRGGERRKSLSAAARGRRQASCSLETRREGRRAEAEASGRGMGQMSSQSYCLSANIYYVLSKAAGGQCKSVRVWCASQQPAPPVETSEKRKRKRKQTRTDRHHILLKIVISCPLKMNILSFLDQISKTSLE